MAVGKRSFTRPSFFRAEGFPPRVNRAVGRVLAPYREGLVGVDRRVIVAAACSFLFIAARLGAITFLAIYFIRTKGISAPEVGAAFLVENLTRALVGPFAGALSDRVGRRPVIVGAAALSAVAMPACLLVDSALGLLLWSATIGLTQAPFFPAITALLLDYAPPEKRQSVLAVNYTALSVGYTLGVLPAGFLAERSFAALMGASSGAFALVALLTYFVARDAPKSASTGPPPSVLANLATAGRDRAFLALALLGFLFPLGLGLASLALPVHAADAGVPKSTIGVILSTNGVLIALLAIPMNARLERGGPFRFLPVAGVLLAAAWGVLALSGAPLALLLAVALFSLGEIVFSTALPAAVASLAPARMRGAYQGAWSMVFAGSIGLGLYASGIGRDTVGWPVTWAAFGAATLLAGALLALSRGWFRSVADARAGAAARE